MNLWKRYLFGHLILSFSLLLLSLLILYISIDFSIHGARFLSRDTTSIIDIGINYLRHFAKFTDLFFSLSFLLASLKVLLDLNTNRELLAFQAAGISSKQLLLPFFFLAALLMVGSLINNQWIAPDAQEAARDFHKAHSKKKQVATIQVFSFPLQDGSEMVYQNYDPMTQELFDVFWIRSTDDFWHMHTLTKNQASLADHFVRNKKGIIEKRENYPSYIFELEWEKEVTNNRFIPFENRSFGTLFRQAYNNSAESEKCSAHFHYKLASSFFPFLIIFGVALPAFHFARIRSLFLLFAFSLFIFIGFKMFLDAMLILAENQVLSPLFAIWLPIVIGFSIALYFFSRLR